MRRAKDKPFRAAFLSCPFGEIFVQFDILESLLERLSAERTGLLKKSDKIIGLSFALWQMIVVTGCWSMPDNQFNAAKVESLPVSTLPSKAPEVTTVIDVPKFAYKSPAEFEQVFGKAVEIKQVKGDAKQMPGEYRLYRTSNHPQGLSVHFYGGKALIFNLVLGKAVKSPREALLNYFRLILEMLCQLKKISFSKSGKAILTRLTLSPSMR